MASCVVKVTLGKAAFSKVKKTYYRIMGNLAKCISAQRKNGMKYIVVGGMKNAERKKVFGNFCSSD